MNLQTTSNALLALNDVIQTLLNAGEFLAAQVVRETRNTLHAAYSAAGGDRWVPNV